MTKDSAPADLRAAHNGSPSERGLAIGRRGFLAATAAAAFGTTGKPMAATRAASAGEWHELGLAAAARAIRDGDMSSEAYAARLLERARAHADLRAFITLDEGAVLEAARRADRALRAGRRGPLLGVPLAVKDSYLTSGLTTTVGTSVLAGYRPARDADVIVAAKAAGAIVFGKNNLAEMSYNITGYNEHHGQARNPYDRARITGGSSSGAGACVAARLVPAAFGGDTVGSIRVPASLCGVVGFKPTPGRWPSGGVAPISATLDTTGLLARNTEDCELVDAIVTRIAPQGAPARMDLKGVSFAYAPAQHLVQVDGPVASAFRETLRKLADAGAEIVEVDLGEDFHALAARSTWPIFFHETQGDVREFLAAQGVPASFEQIHAGLGERLKARWSQAVVPSGAEYVTADKYRAALSGARAELRRRFAANAFARADVLLLPTTPCAAPQIENQWNFEVGGKSVTDLVLARHTHPGSSAGLPGISLPMGLEPRGLPLGLELDAAPGNDRKLLALARRVEKVIGRVHGPGGF